MDSMEQALVTELTRAVQELAQVVGVLAGSIGRIEALQLRIALANEKLVP